MLSFPEFCRPLQPSYIDAKNVAQAFGYTEEQLISVPDGSHMGLSCGNPVATASIKEVCSSVSFLHLNADHI